MTLRMTPQRRAVLDVILNSMDHPTAGEIYHRVLEKLPGIAYGTVYNALNYLIDHEQVVELSFGDKASRYDGNVKPHHHGLCEVCGQLYDLTITVPVSAIALMEQDSDFQVHDYHVLFRGVCRSCRTPHS